MIVAAEDYARTSCSLQPIGPFHVRTGKPMPWYEHYGMVLPKYAGPSMHDRR